MTPCARTVSSAVDYIGREFRAEMGRDAGFKSGSFAGVVAFGDFADLVEAGDDGGGAVGDAQFNEFANGTQLGADLLDESFHSLARLRGNADAGGELLERLFEDAGVFEFVHFVENHDRGAAGGADFREDGVDGGDLVEGVRVRDVNYMKQQLRLRDFLKRGLESLDQAVRGACG